MSDDRKPLAGILKKIVKAIRDDAKELSEAIIDSAGSGNFEKKIDAAKSHLQQAKKDISKEMEREIQSSRKIKFLNESILQQEENIIEAISQNSDDQALKLADEMIDMQQSRDAEWEIQKSHQLHLSHLTRQLEDAERYLKDLERQFEIVKTTQKIQHVTNVVAKSIGKADSGMLSAKRSLERIRKKQKKIEKQIERDEKWLLLSSDSKAISDQRSLDAHKLLRKLKDRE